MQLHVCPRDWTFTKDPFTPTHMLSLQTLARTSKTFALPGSLQNTTTSPTSMTPTSSITPSPTALTGRDTTAKGKSLSAIAQRAKEEGTSAALAPCKAKSSALHGRDNPPPPISASPPSRPTSDLRPPTSDLRPPTTNH